MTDETTLRKATSNHGPKTWAQLLESEAVIKAQPEHPFKGYQVDSIEREMRSRRTTTAGGFTIKTRTEAGS